MEAKRGKDFSWYLYLFFRDDRLTSSKKININSEAYIFIFYHNTKCLNVVEKLAQNDGNNYFNENFPSQNNKQIYHLMLH